MEVEIPVGEAGGDVAEAEGESEAEVEAEVEADVAEAGVLVGSSLV